MRKMEKVRAGKYTFPTLPRGAIGAPCPKCGGYAQEDENSPTKQEIEAYDCGRSFACCTGAFVCNLCGYSFIVGIDPPECGW